MMDDNFDDLLAGFDEASLPKYPRLSGETSCQPTTTESVKPKPGTTKLHTVLVNPKQKGNPLLKGITSVPWEFDDIAPDYVMGPTTCALFLSIKYHNMNPDYIHDRLKALGKSYELRVLLVQVDVGDPHMALKSLTRICLLADLTLMLAWNAEEAGRVIETYKIYENKPPDKIMEKVENDPHQKIVNALTSIKPVNKTDAMTLISTFGTLEGIIKASEVSLSKCPGFGLKKASKLYRILHEPFMKKTGVMEAQKQVQSSRQPSPSFDNDDEIDIQEIEALLSSEKP